MVDKITTSNVLMRNFSPILMVADKAFRTNMTVDELSCLVRMQLEYDPEWHVEIFDVDGNESEMPVYTLGDDSKSHVIIPDDATIEEAKTRIQNVLNSKI